LDSTKKFQKSRRQVFVWIQQKGHGRVQSKEKSAPPSMILNEHTREETEHCYVYRLQSDTAGL